MKIAASPQPPLVNCFQDFYGDWLCNGSNVEVIQLLSKKLNFRLDWLVLANNNLEQPKQTMLNNNISYKAKNHNISYENEYDTIKGFNYSGVIGLVSSGRAFMAANGIMSTFDREKNGLLLSEPFDSFKLHFLLSKSVRDHDHIFIKPFSSTAWLGILISSIFIAIAFYIINSTSYHYILIEDKFLSKQVPLFKSLYYYLTKIVLNKRKKLFRIVLGKNLISKLFYNINNNINDDENRRYSEGTTTSNESIVLFDREVDKMISSNGMLNFDTKFVSFRIEQRRRHKELCRRWLYERKKARKLSRLKHKTGFFKLPYIIWYVAGSLANQGGETEDLPHASSTRILVAFWWLYLIVICSIHSGILTAILTFPKQLDFIQTLDDYLNLEESEKSLLKLTVDKNSEIANLLSNSDNLHKSPLQQLLISNKLINMQQPIVEIDFVRHRERLLADVQLGQAAYLEEKSMINMIITQEYFDHKPPKCHFKSSRYPIDVIPMSLILNKNELLLSNKTSPSSNNNNCLNMINILLTRIMRTGLAEKWRRKYEAQGNDCLNTVIINAGDVSKIEVRHVILAFWLLAFGLLLGALSLVIEVVWLFTIDIDDDDDEDDYYRFDDYNSKRRSSKNNNSIISSKDSSSSGIFSSSSSGSDSNDDDDSSIELKFGHKIITPQSKMAIRSLKDGGKNLSFKRALKRSNKSKKLFQFKRVTPLPSSLLFLGQHERSMEFNDDVENSQDDDLSQIVRQNKQTILKIDSIDNEQQKNDIEELGKAIKLDKKRKKAAKLSERRARRLKRTLGMVKRLQEGKIYSDSKLLLNKVSHKARRASQAIVGHFGAHPATQSGAGFSARKKETNVNGINKASDKLKVPDSSDPIRRRRPLIDSHNRVGISKQVKVIPAPINIE